MEGIDKYSRLTRWTHWLTAVFVIISLYSGMQMEDNLSLSMLRTHAISGGLLWVLLILRTAALRYKRPKPLHDNKRLQQLYHTVHWALLICLTLLLLSGSYTFIQEEYLPALQNMDSSLLPNLERTGMSAITKAHHILPKVMILFLVLHISGMLLYWVRHKRHPFGRIF